MEATPNTKIITLGGNRQERRLVQRDLLKNARHKRLRIIIVGGGVAGLYAARRYLRMGHDVILYEARTRLGGRLDSITLSGIGTTLEAGAMRLTTADELLEGLIKDLGLKTIPHEMPVGYSLRGIGVPIGASTATTSTDDLASTSSEPPQPYKLKGEAQDLIRKHGMRPDVLISYAIVCFLKQLAFEPLARDNARAATDLQSKIAALDTSEPSLQDFTKRDWKLITQYGRWNGTPIYDLGIQNVFSRFLGSDGAQFVVDTLGYDTVPANWNAAAAMPWFALDFSPDTKYRMIVGGFGRLVNGLVEGIEEAGGKIYTGWQLTHLTPIGSGSAPRWHLHFKILESGKVQVEEADRVVLAMPPGPIERLMVDHPAWIPFKDKYLSAVQKRSLLKIFLVYECPTPWWKGFPLPGADTARICTNLHVRDVYFYSNEWIKAHSDYLTTSNPHRAVVMVYTDGEHVDFFRPAMTKSASNQPHYKQPENRDGISPLDETDMQNIVRARGASKRLIAKIHEQFEEMLGLEPDSIPEPLFALYTDWAGDPFERSGWHTWNCGVEPWAVARRMLDPIGTGTLSIVGEAFSDVQGWVEGALKSVEYDLSHRPGYDMPAWLHMSDPDFREYVTLVHAS
jgi:phytoene dehydrogenase-like protein